MSSPQNAPHPRSRLANFLRLHEDPYLRATLMLMVLGACIAVIINNLDSLVIGCLLWRDTDCKRWRLLVSICIWSFILLFLVLAITYHETLKKILPLRCPECLRRDATPSPSEAPSTGPAAPTTSTDQMDALEKRLRTEHDKAVEELRTEHDKAVEELRSEHQRAMQDKDAIIERLQKPSRIPVPVPKPKST